jgi:hypothetical protein
MQSNSIFNTKRFFLLLRNDLYRNYRTLLIGASTVAVIYFISVLPQIFFAHTSVDYDFHVGFFPTAFLITGYLLSAGVFAEIHNAQKNTAFFMLPATILEKLSSRLFLTTIVFIPLAVFFYIILNLISLLLAKVFTGWGFPVLNPFDPGMLKVMAVYLVTQSLFLFGSSYYKKHAFMKTGVSLFALAIVLSIFAGIVFRIVYHDYFHGMSFMDQHVFTDVTALEDFANTLVTIVKPLFWFVLAPLFWILGYLRLSEKEV